MAVSLRNGCSAALRILRASPSACVSQNSRSVGSKTPSLDQQQQQQQQQQQRELELDDTQNNAALGLNGELLSAASSQLHLIEPNSAPRVPAYRLLSPSGELLEGAQEQLSASDLSEAKVLELYKQMVMLNSLDKVMFDSQRQGRVSFYMTSFGEEAAQLGSAAALMPSDWIFAQYREPGLLLHRQVTLRTLMSQCYGNRHDLGRGRQMPVHYGSREHNYVTISSPLATQMPQAAGVAYALRRADANQEHRRVVACYFGEGAASEGDAHAAMNFAATLSCPTLFFCRNNQYAISTPASEQFRSDGVVTRALGYGMGALRVDGNDLFAVYLATQRARHLVATESRPYLVEAVTYRVGHHSTSDDSSAYRHTREVAAWQAQLDPLHRIRVYLERAGVWNDALEKEQRARTRADVIEALNWAERELKPPVDSMFDDVYDELPPNLRAQRDELASHLSRFEEQYASLATHEPNAARK